MTNIILRLVFRIPFLLLFFIYLMNSIQIVLLELIPEYYNPKASDSKMKNSKGEDIIILFYNFCWTSYLVILYISLSRQFLICTFRNNTLKQEKKQTKIKQIELQKLFKNSSQIATKSEMIEGEEDEFETSNKYCNICKLEKQEMTYHCDQCNECIIEMDHHSYLFGNCVGKSSYINHLSFYFYFYLISCMNIYFLFGQFENSKYFILFLLSICTAIFCLQRLFFNFFYIIPNQTTSKEYSFHHFQGVFNFKQIQEKWRKRSEYDWLGLIY